jgi:two-component system sensor histidine kinase/response regulator
MSNVEIADQSAPGRFQAVDHALALSRVGGDSELLGEIARLFLTDAPHMLNAIEAAICAGDAYALERSAHAFKGCVSNFGGAAATSIAFSLEQMGRKQELSGAAEAFQRLRAAEEAVEVELQRLIG